MNDIEFIGNGKGSILWLTGFDRSASSFIFENMGDRLDEFCDQMVAKVVDKCAEYKDSQIYSDEEYCCFKNRGGLVLFVWDKNISQESIEMIISRRKPDKVVILRQPNNFNKRSFMNNVSELDYSFITSQVPQYNSIKKDMVLDSTISNLKDSSHQDQTDSNFTRYNGEHPSDNPDQYFTNMILNKEVIDDDVITEDDLVNTGIIKWNVINLKESKKHQDVPKKFKDRMWDLGIGIIGGLIVNIASGACQLMR